MKRLLACSAVCALAMAGVASATASARHASTLSSARIVFSSVRDHDTRELFAINSDGSRVRRLTSNLPFASDPSWSPDGARIAFEVDPRSGPRRAIWLVNADGSGARRLVEDAEDPAWSPDGMKIAFASGHEIRVLTLATGALRTLHAGPDTYADPAWTPDGGRIAFARTGWQGRRPGDEGETYVVGADGSGLGLLGPGREPAWSPDGMRLAVSRTFRSDASGAVYGRVWLMANDGSGAAELAFRLANGSNVSASSPAWSPDGSTVAASDGLALYEVGVDGSSPAKHWGDRGDGSHVFGDHPAWSPDGRRLVAELGGQLRISTRSGDTIALFTSAADLAPTYSRTGSLAWERRASTWSDAAVAVWLARGEGVGGRELVPFASHPALSLDGQRVAYVRLASTPPFTTDFDSYVFVRALNAATAHKLARGRTPAWSSDGKRLAVSSRGRIAVVTVRVGTSIDATLPPQQGERPVADEDPAWSPDGKEIAFTRTTRCSTAMTGCRPRPDVAVVTLETRKVRRLAAGSNPAWSPDGKTIAFVSDRDGNEDIYVIDADGKGERRVTKNPGADTDPSWGVDPRVEAASQTSGVGRRSP
ncbi:MAG: hypothetical protein LC713_04895 [Actinobacteria bacterium]|nr:hypothetical protein [Actinomycetota bacterium]